MDGLANGADMVPCPHCGQEIRRGMIRCRECGKTVIDTPAEGDFALSGHALLPSQEPTCPLCGAVLEPGATDCASCTSALLDQLLQGPETGVPETGAPVAGPHSPSSHPAGAASELRVRRAIPPADGPPGVSHLREPPRLAVQEHAVETAKSGGPGAAAAHGKPAPHTAAPAKSGVLRKEKPAAATAAPAQAMTETTEEDLGAATTAVETSAACTALLASLSKADVLLRCEIATALGKLGDKLAMAPLERHLVDQDIRVRRAVAAALVQLGHPKGQSLLDIAERKPAKEVLTVAKSSAAKPRPSGGGGGGIDAGQLKLLGGVLAVAVVGGGIWYWMNMPPSKPARPKKGKPAATAKKTATPPKKVRKSTDD